MSRYLEQCIDTVRGANLDELESLRVGDTIGYGSAFTTRQLGSVSVHDSSEIVAVKVPVRAPVEAATRVVREVALIDRLLDKVPDLQPLVPHFLGILSVENSEIKAVLTDDATKGGNLELRPTPLSQDVRQLIQGSLGPYTESVSVFDEEEADRTLAFTAGGKERLLDFTPSPFEYAVTRFLRDEAYMDILRNYLDDLTLQLAANSNLAQSLTKS